MKTNYVEEISPLKFYGIIVAVRRPSITVPNFVVIIRNVIKTAIRKVGRTGPLVGKMELDSGNEKIFVPALAKTHLVAHFQWLSRVIR